MCDFVLKHELMDDFIYILGADTGVVVLRYSRSVFCEKL